MTKEEGEKRAKEFGSFYIETSALTDKNVKEPFRKIVSLFLDKEKALPSLIVDEYFERPRALSHESISTWEVLEVPDMSFKKKKSKICGIF